MRDDLIHTRAEELTTHARAQHRAYPGTDLGAYWQGYEAGVDALHAVLTAQGETAPQLRAAWEAGFTLCRSYGDNHAHFDGEQKERQWRAFLAAQGEIAPASEDNGSGFCVHCCLPMGSHRLQCPRDVQPAASPLPAAEGLEQLAQRIREAEDQAALLTIADELDALTALRAVAEGRR